MKRLRPLIFLIMALGVALSGAAMETIDTLVNIKTITAPDTIIRTDTIIVKEVITRTDIVHRTEKVVRYEEKYIGGTEKHGEEFEVIKPITPDEFDGSVVSEPSLYAPKDGGQYVWVPDSLNPLVSDLLEGKLLTSDEPEHIEEPTYDPNEKVVFRGDTIPMVLKSRNLGRYDRGLFNFLFIPKGIWQLGITASYGEFSTEDLQILDLVSDIDFKGRIFSVRPYFSYFFKNNVSLGVRLGYTDGKADIGAFNVDIDEDMSFNLHDIMYRSQNYSASVTLTQYLGITRKGRFGVFNEVELALAGGKSDFHRPYNNELRKTHTDIFELGLNFSPGICVYVMEQLSFNVSFGVFGLNLKHEKQKVNDEPSGERTTSGANFRFNIFNINFGIAVNI